VIKRTHGKAKEKKIKTILFFLGFKRSIFPLQSINKVITAITPTSQDNERYKVVKVAVISGGIIQTISLPILRNIMI
jgi:hypothetical protein